MLLGMNMRLLVMYDTFYGNTERVADLVAEELRTAGHEVSCRRQSESGEEDFIGVRFWVLGSPTRWGRPTFRFKTLLRNAVKEAGKDHDFVVFDTRFEEVHAGAADRLHRMLVREGLRPLLPPQPFFVEGHGLLPDQEERARELGRTIVSLI
jgi:flavorubredoxin